jgi:EPS-associated MarR family transcriptional regulator|tara:strand:- start:11 stop:322 length:312 start_codon:yes stop_codon:yes gene_type:complete
MSYIKNNNESDNFNVLRKLEKNPSITQRELSNKLGISLGKINYCLKELRNKGLIKISNFRKNKNKITYVYLLTPKGISAKTKLTINFMKIKLREYEDLKRDID